MKGKLNKILFAVIFSNVLNGCSLMKTSVVDLDGLRVAYIVKSGGLEDKSVGELGVKGIEKAKSDFGIKEEIIQVDLTDPAKAEKSLKKIADRNDLIIMNGRDLSEISQEVSAMNRDKSMVVIGVKENETNIQDVNFKDEEGGFLMGIIAGRTTKSNKLGFVTYEKFEDTDRLLAGFIAGVKTVNEEAAKGLISGELVKYVGLETSEDQVYKVANDLNKSGVDIIIEKLSIEESGMLKAAKENKFNIIGVGTDKYEYYPDYKEVVLSSILKKVDEVIYESIENRKNGKLVTGDLNPKVLDLESGKLDYSESTEKTVSKEVFDEVKKYKELIIRKKITAPATRLQAIEFKVK